MSTTTAITSTTLPVIPAFLEGHKAIQEALEAALANPTAETVSILCNAWIASVQATAADEASPYRIVGLDLMNLLTLSGKWRLAAPGENLARFLMEKVPPLAIKAAAAKKQEETQSQQQQQPTSGSSASSKPQAAKHTFTARAFSQDSKTKVPLVCKDYGQIKGCEAPITMDIGEDGKWHAYSPEGVLHKHGEGGQ